MSEERYASIRDLLGEVVGQTIVDITQHDAEFFDRTGKTFIQFMLSSGDTLRIYIQDHGMVINPEDDEEDHGDIERSNS